MQAPLLFNTLFIGFIFAIPLGSTAWAEPYTGVILNYFDTVQSDQNQVQYGNTSGSGFVLGWQSLHDRTRLVARQAN